MRRIVYWPALAVVLLAVPIAMAQTQPAPPPAASTQPIPDGKDYVIGADDVLDIQVWGSNDLNQTVFVRPDGRLSLPLVGEIMVAGKTVQQLQDHLLGVYDKTVKGAVVTVLVKEIKSRPVYFVGGFGKPGVMQLTGDLTLLQAISPMGASCRRGRREGLPSRRERKIPIDFNRLAQRGEASQNPKLEPGDSVVVPLAEAVYVNGEVKKPGAVKYAGDLTLLKASPRRRPDSPGGGQPRGHHPRRPREEGSNPGRRRSDHAIAGWQPGRSPAAERHHHGSATTLLGALGPGPEFPRGGVPLVRVCSLDPTH